MNPRVATTMSKGQLAAAYGVSPNTFRKWLDAIAGLHLQPGQRMLTPKQVALIFEHLGKP